MRFARRRRAVAGSRARRLESRRDARTLAVVADPGSAVRDVGFVQESGPEDEAAKIDLFELLDAVAPTQRSLHRARLDS